MNRYVAELVGTFVLVFASCGAAVLAGDKIGFLGPIRGEWSSWSRRARCHRVRNPLHQPQALLSCKGMMYHLAG
jgi:hypothetical protein